MSSQHSTASVVEPPGSPRSKSTPKLIDLPTEILILIASYLKPTDLIPLIQTCKQCHKLYTSLVWEHVGFTPPGYRHPGRQFNFPGSHAASHISPDIDRYFSPTEPQPVDLFSYLILLGNISRTSLEAIKTLTVCAGYDFAGLTARKQRNGDTPLHVAFKNSSAYYHNTQAGQDLAIARIYHQWPTADPELMSHYSSYYKSEFRTIEQWPKLLEKAEVSLFSWNSFQSSVFPREQIKVGKNALESDYLELYVPHDLTAPKPSDNTDLAHRLTMGLLQFSDFLQSKLLAPNLLPNLCILSINIDTSITSQSDIANENYVGQHAAPLLMCITGALPNLPNVKVALNCNLPHYEDLLLDITEELALRITVLRLVCLETIDEFANLTTVLRIIEKCAVLENLELITQGKDPFLLPQVPEEVLTVLVSVVKLASLTSFHLSSTILTPDFLLHLPSLTVEDLSLKFKGNQVLNLMRKLLAQNLTSTRTLRLCSDIPNCRVGTISDIGCSNLMKLYVRNLKLNAATRNKILAANPALTRIQTF